MYETSDDGAPPRPPTNDTGTSMTRPDSEDPAAVGRLLALLDLEATGDDRFRGDCETGWSRVYGGQVVAQALVAASRTIGDSKLAHSLHASFLRPGDPAVPIDFAVERERDGRSFATRRVVASQAGRAMFSMAASFHAPEGGFQHAAAMPVVSPPEALLNDRQLLERNAPHIPEPFLTQWRNRDRPFEWRPVEPDNPLAPVERPPTLFHWFRLATPTAPDPVLARVLLAYASDMTLLDTCLMPHAVAWTDKKLTVASLDHALWFHAEPNVDDWLLSAQDSPVAGGARGLNRGLIFARDGRLVASAVQEGLIRYAA